MKQSTSTVLMVRPATFRMNEQTAVNNYYQQPAKATHATDALHKALHEFDTLANLLSAEGVQVIVVQDHPQPEKPDALFPNNWVSLHEGGTKVLYSMYAANRRLEKNIDIDTALSTRGFYYPHIVSLERENEKQYLEGTGSMVLDRKNKLAYASISERTDAQLAAQFGAALGFQLVMFHSFQQVGQQRLPIYHTNVMMCIGDRFAVLCSSSIDDEAERIAVQNALTATGHTLIEISEEQVNHFAGNMLELKNQQGETLIVMSSSAYHALTAAQRTQLSSFGKLIHAELRTIETLGGGSARCMIAEVF